MDDKNRKIVPWGLVTLFLFALPPVGALMLIANILPNFTDLNIGRRKGNSYRKGGYRFDENYMDVPYRSSDSEIGGKLRDEETSRPSQSRATPRRGGSLSRTLKEGKGMRLGGIITTLAGIGVSAIVFLGMLLDYSTFVEAALASMITLLAIGTPGLALTFWGNSILSKAQRLRRYSQVIGAASEVSLDRLAGAMGVSYDRVCSDLDKMLDDGYYEGYYIDNERRVFTCGTLGSAPYGAAEKAKPAEKTGERQVHPADMIRDINNNISHPEVSEKITRLENLTRRIYNYTDAYPEKEEYARSFKERYLPKTIKILESYSRFERSGSSGRNVREAMKEVEAVLDVLIGSFEKQLDMLYMDEALDVTTDIDVLESMISGDGLTDSPFATLEDEQF